jgi:hypothetical protein
MRWRGMSMERTLTLMRSPGLTKAWGSRDELGGELGDVDEAVLVDADVDEGAEVGDVGDDAFELMPSLRSLME